MHREDNAVRPADTSLFYSLWARAPLVPVATTYASCASAKATIGSGFAAGLYNINAGAGAFQVFCDVDGFTLAGVISNADSQQWTINDDDGNYAGKASMWQNSIVLGTVTSATPNTNADFKSRAWNELVASEIRVKFKDQQPLLTSVAGCLANVPLRTAFDSWTFCLAGSAPMAGVCAHACNLASYTYQAADVILSRAGVINTELYLKTGECEGCQDGNKDRSMISTGPARSNVDFAMGLGSFCQQTSDITNDMGIYDDNSVRPSDTALFYSIWVR